VALQSERPLHRILYPHLRCTVLVTAPAVENGTTHKKKEKKRIGAVQGYTIKKNNSKSWEPCGA